MSETGTDAGVAERTESEHHAAYCEMVAAELDSGVRIWPSSAWFRCTAALLAQQATQLQELQRNRDAWRNSSASYGCAFIDQKVRAETAESQLTSLRAELEATRQALKHWQVCENCLELMYEGTLTRAEAAERALAEARRALDEAKAGT